jgi:hypothetical protein
MSATFVSLTVNYFLCKDNIFYLIDVKLITMFVKSSISQPYEKNHSTNSAFHSHFFN